MNLVIAANFDNVMSASTGNARKQRYRITDTEPDNEHTLSHTHVRTLGCDTNGPAI